MSQSSDKTINILLVGETGAGKSTTLNALTNYLKFDGDYKKAYASANELEEVIPIPFSLPAYDSGDKIKIGSDVFDDNERQISGLSATIAPISYVFDFELNSIRVIDTPGIGDTSGPPEDKENFFQILLHLQKQQKLNAIVFVLRNSDSRMTTFYQYCITQLLLHLHRSVSENIIFCFTHSRSSMFGPGDGFTTLQAFLEQENDLVNKNKLKLIPGKNCFFIDNDVYRMLVAKKQGYPLDEDTEFEYRSSWNKSVKQVKNLLKSVISMPPHNLNETMALNQASKIILELAHPMIQIQATINENIEEIEATKLKYSDLNDLVNTKIWDLRSEKLDMPTTVCAAAKCFECVDGKVIPKICHENCWCPWVRDDTKDQFMLRMCEAIDWSFNCQKCKCSFREHKHISYKYTKVIRPGISKEKLAEINQAPDQIGKIKLALNELQTIQHEFKNELLIIQNISVMFGYLLSNNSIHSKVFEDYLQNLIDEEIRKEGLNVGALKRLKRELENGVRDLTDAIKENNSFPVHLDDIPTLKKQLLDLKHNGENFRQILETNKKVKEDKFKYQEKTIPFTVKKENPMFGDLFWFGKF